MKFSAMSPVEIQFIRLYVTSLRREYYLVRSVMDLMGPHGLNVKDFAAATNMAVTLQTMHDDFETALNCVAKKDNIRKINFPTGPTADELVDLFSLSFFKLVTVKDSAKTAGGEEKIDNGWFSGKPTEWKNSLQLYTSAPKNAGTYFPDLLSNFFNTLFKFFHFDAQHKKWNDDSFGTTKKLWPNNSLENFIEDQYFDDDDDTGMSQFDMFFDPDLDD